MQNYGNFMHTLYNRHYLWKFLLLQILCHIWIKLLCISLVQTVDLSLLLNLHIFIHQNELTNGLVETRERTDEKLQSITIETSN